MAEIGSSWANGSWVSVGGWAAGTWAGDEVSIGVEPDMNTRMRAYLLELYSLPASSDMTTMVRRYLNSQTGDMNARFLKLVRDATSAMS